MTVTADHQVVSRDEWLAARKALLAREKEFTRLNDALSAERRALPWVRVEKTYVFEGPDGKETLAGLFGGRSQLIVYHFMFGPNWEEGCKSCSFWADNFNGIDVHLAARDVTLLAVSSAPYAKIRGVQDSAWAGRSSGYPRTEATSTTTITSPSARRKWNEATFFTTTPGSKSSGTERPGISVFNRDEDGSIFHTYSCYARGSRC